MRILTRRRDEPVDEEFYRRRVREAVDYRRALWSAAAWALPEDIGERAFRLVFAEADHLPGFIVDYYAGQLVFQTLALGVEEVKDFLVRLVREEAGPSFPVRGAYERNDAPVRRLEGLPLVKGPCWGEAVPRVTIREGDWRMVVDLEEGQKTGYFLDQRENRAAIAPYVRGRRVLDCFCYTGGFAVAAAVYGAGEVLGVDSSPEALALARENVALNGLDGERRAGGDGGADGRVSFVEANVFDFLRQADADRRSWDTVILDPPAFAKSRAALEGAVRGYKEINLRAMRLIPPGGHLLTSSCSQHLGEDLFLEVLASAAADTRRRIRVVEVRSQARDHPFLPAAPETRYLKFAVLQVH